MTTSTSGPLKLQTLFTCPICQTTTTSRTRLVTHLCGSRRNRGHGLPEASALQVASGVTVPLQGQFLPPLRLPTNIEELQRNPATSFLTQICLSLVADKRLPKYAFERRIDPYLGLFLPAILRAAWGWDVDSVAPEFPIRKDSNNQSKNADRLLFRRSVRGSADEAWVLHELKTDVDSLCELQLQTYRSAMGQGMPVLVDGIRTIQDNTECPEKYAELLARLVPFPPDRPVETVYISPVRVDTPDSRVHSLTFAELGSLSLDEHAAEWELFRAIVIPNI